ncbi:MAG TPA: L-histidine N(alpha)-methyltransferase [Bacteroidales bacterium]|nr:L-histidine N(alpha)-methyltransferase [Bacteroidales bacterium]
MVNKRAEEEQAIVDEQMMPDIAADTLKGLTASPKHLFPKYFYDKRGSEIFGEITRMPGYYLTKAEKEIFDVYGKVIASKINSHMPLKLIELGSGDGLKTKILIGHLSAMNADLCFMPVDISKNANDEILESVKKEFPGVTIRPVTTDYFRIAGRIEPVRGTKQAILFLGSNIGNIEKREMNQFFGNISDIMMPGDNLLIGFDMKKSPSVIMKAYNDAHGITTRFNLNLLERLNREAGMNFVISMFEHHTSYDPVSGEVRSYIVSTMEHTVFSSVLGTSFQFREWEPVFMEMSKKFDFDEIYSLASSYGFSIIENFSDKREYFTDSLWVKT